MNAPKTIHVDSNGTRRMNFKGKTPVFSGCSGGTAPRTTRGEISLSPDNKFKVGPRGKSRVPAYKDTRKAIADFCVALGVEIPKERPQGLRRQTTTAGAKYVGLGKWWIGRSDKDKFSLREEKAIPFDVLLKLLAALDEYIEGS